MMSTMPIVFGVVAASSLAQANQQSDVGATPDEVRAIVAEMTADADGRSSLLAADAGHDGAFNIRSSDGRFELQVKGLMQFRYNVNLRDDDVVADEDETGFSVPRTLLFFKGHIGDPKFSYQVRANFRRTDGQAVLDDAFVSYAFDDNWTLRWGQGLMAFSREWYHGDTKLQTVERSLSALMFGEQRAQLIDLTYRNEDIRAIATFSDGFRSLNNDLGSDPADWALTGRVEWKLSGAWKDVIGGYTSPRGSELASALGAAAHLEEGDDAANGRRLFAWTADAIVKGDGWNLFGAATGYHVEDEAGVGGADFDDLGLVAQGGAYVTDDVELFARWTSIIPDDDRSGDEVLDAVAAGLNWYLHGHAARFTLQAEWFFDATNDTVAGAPGRTPTNTLFNALPSDEADQLAITAQFQLAF